MSRIVILTVAVTIFAGDVDAGEDAPDEFRLHPIGYVRKSDDRVQIVLNKKYEPGLLGVDGFSHICVFWWFSLSDTPEKRATLQVRPMGNPENPISGVFATRSPRRPNLIALTLCKVLTVNDNVIEVEKMDAFENTPVIDIKPFIPGYDSAKDAQVPDWFEKSLKKRLAQQKGT